jgi:seryl-tRNA synthetase
MQRPLMDVPRAAGFRYNLLDAGLLVATGVDGLYQRSGTFEGIVRGIEALVSAAGADQDAPLFYYPPVMPRADFELTDYFTSSPDLIGSVDTFAGNDHDHATLLRIAEQGGDWTQALSPADIVLCSAACHSLYPSLRGAICAGGRRIECQAYVFRHEPSLDPARMQAFRQHEFVYAGEPQGAIAHRDLWLDRGLRLLRGLDIEAEAGVANDPFFGRVARMLATSQTEIAVKYEIVAPIGNEQRTPIASTNYHQDHFGLRFGIETADGAVAHTACSGFGLERVALALLSQHGLEPDLWPARVRDQLWP